MEARDADGAAPSSVSDPGRMEQGLLGSGLLGRLSIFSKSQTGWDCGEDGTYQSLVNTERIPNYRGIVGMLEVSLAISSCFLPTKASVHFSPSDVQHYNFHSLGVFRVTETCSFQGEY